MIKNVCLSIYIILVIIFVGHSFERVSADFAPEKMPLDNEARQEMRLEPRSFIPHPRPNRADVSTNKQTKAPNTKKDESDEKHNESSGHSEDGEEVVKGDEGSSSGSGEESISLNSHLDSSSQKQRKVLSLGTLADEHMKSFFSPVVYHSPDSKAMSIENGSQTTPSVTPHLVNLSGDTSPQNITRDNGKTKTVSEENKKTEDKSPVGEADEVEDEKESDKEDVKDAQQEGSTVGSMDEEPKKESGPRKEDVGDALKLGLKNAKPAQTKDGGDDRDDNDGNESGSGIDEEKTKTSKFDDEEKDEKTENAENAATVNKENGGQSEENDKKMKEDSEKNDVDDDEDDKENNDQDNMSGSVPTKESQPDSTPNRGTTAPTEQGSLDKDTTDIDKTTNEEDDDDDSEKEDKMEDAINKEKEEVDEYEDDEDEDEENESQLETKEPKELQPEMTPEVNHQTFQQSTVHKLPNGSITKIQNSSNESLLQTPQQQIHQVSTVHKVKQVQKLENSIQKTRKISVKHAPVHNTVHTEKNVQNTKATMKKHEQDKQDKPAKVVKATHHTSHHDVKPKHHEVKHNDKKHKKPRKSKSLLKYIHRPNVHYKKKTEARLHKKPAHKCNSDNIKTGYSLKGGTRAGHVEDLGGSAGMHECIQRCCHKKVCDVALMLDGRCFGVACYSKELCKPVMVPHPHYVNSQIAFLDRAQRRDEVGGARPEFDCKYGELTIRNNHRWSGELCGGVVTCRNGVVTVEKCPGVPAKPTNCANPKLVVQQRPGQCCIKKWICKDKSCEFAGRRIPHGVSLSDQLCTGVVKCMNGHLQIKECPKLPEKPTSCAHPKLKITTVPGQCCKKRWVCPDKSCSYGDLKVDDGERLTDASCAVVMECKNGFLNFKQCPSPPPVPNACLNPTLKVKRILGECCHMKWACAQETKSYMK